MASPTKVTKTKRGMKKAKLEENRAKKSKKKLTKLKAANKLA